MQRRMSLRPALFALILLAPAGAAERTDAEKEAFLREAEIESLETLPRGVTASRRATLLDARGTRHDAHVQSIDRTAGVSGVRDYYGFNVAAYRLDRLLGFGLVPVSVVRNVEGRASAVTWWIDDYWMLEAERWRARRQPPDVRSWNKRMLTARVFTELVYNVDANLGNILIDRSWKTWLVDFTRAFRPVSSLQKPNELTRIDRDLLERLRATTSDELADAVGDLLSPAQLAALDDRRADIVDHFDGLVAQAGEAAVFFQSR